MNIRRVLGVILCDMPIYLAALFKGPDGYLAIHNRNERVEPATDQTGYRCMWQWTSELHAPKVFPTIGLRLMRQALSQHPIRLGSSPTEETGADPQVSFIIGHRGMARLPHLLRTLQSLAAQTKVRVECIVVEQDTTSLLGPHLPAWVKLVHTVPPSPDMPYCRSWSFNVGVRHARANVFVLHDNDMLVPADYALWILDRVNRGFDVINPKRFIFYLTQSHTDAFFREDAALTDMPAQKIVQNLEAGGSIAFTQESYDRIGGMDESFVGWGGEDNDLWDRAQTLRVWGWGGLPIVHLWHPDQAGKQDPSYQTALYYNSLSKMSIDSRISRLKGLPRGLISGPFNLA